MWLSVAAAVFVVATSIFVWSSRPARPEDATFTIGDGQPGAAGAFVAAPPHSGVPVRFVDGTVFELAPGSSARVATVEPHGAHLVIEKGRVAARVVHRPGSRWRLDVGPFQVAVVGTRFSAAWDASTRVLDLQLEEGAVRVSGGLLKESLHMRAGQRLRAFADEALVELSESEVSGPSPVLETGDDPRAPAPPPQADTVPAPSAAPSASERSRPPAWRSLAAAGKFKEALAAAEQAGFAAECQRLPGADLLALADAARLSGSAARAEQAYTAAHRKLPGGGRASYGLGLVAFDQRRDFVRAAMYFETYLGEQPSGPLRAEATGRLMEAWQRAGRSGDARRVAEQYLARYPEGPQATRARQLLQR